MKTWWKIIRHALGVALTGVELMALGSPPVVTAVDVREYGAVGDGKTKNTAVIQRAIDACARSGGGEVRVAGGTYMTGVIFLKDNVSLALAADGTLLGSPDDCDYPTNTVVRHLDVTKVPRGRATALIIADECRNVGIIGPGTIDCNGRAFVEEAKTKDYGYVEPGSGGESLGENWVNWRYRRIPGRTPPPRMVLFAGCTDVRVVGVRMLQPAAGWGYWVTDCDRVVFECDEVLADPLYANADGIHVNASRDVSIADCHIVAGDDAIAIRCNCRALPAVKPCERVTVTRCRLTSHANAVRIGWLNDGRIRDCAFSDLVIADSACGIGIDLPKFECGMSDYGCEASLYENLSFQNITMERVYSAPVRVEITDDASTRMEAIRNVTISNVTATAYQYPSFRYPNGRELENVRFEDCSFTKVPKGAFPRKWQQVGAAYWWAVDEAVRKDAPGVSYVNCTFE